MRYIKPVLAIILAAMGIALVAQNTEPVETRFLAWTLTMSRAALLLVTLLIGFVLGAVGAMTLARRRRPKE